MGEGDLEHRHRAVGGEGCGQVVGAPGSQGLRRGVGQGRELEQFAFSQAGVGLDDPGPARGVVAAVFQQAGGGEHADEHFGWLGRFFGMDITASNARTRALLDWTPTGPTLLEDIAAGAYPVPG
ncbi:MULTISPECIES: hypothetical protein [Saccharothrix]|uniref:hypothetical protein n=1 Tax=Saccharothrix TaxID=2071 RepID=UPI00093CB35D|nr:hypothetical protein [Saccharothrix sp. CB00851]OKI15443.1 hypothetical protein A6A25_14140 [Saccharothrix sp. CB00851]